MHKLVHIYGEHSQPVSVRLHTSSNARQSIQPTPTNLTPRFRMTMIRDMTPGWPSLIVIPNFDADGNLAYETSDATSEVDCVVFKSGWVLFPPGVFTPTAFPAHVVDSSKTTRRAGLLAKVAFGPDMSAAKEFIDIFSKHSNPRGQPRVLRDPHRRASVVQQQHPQKSVTWASLMQGRLGV